MVIAANTTKAMTPFNNEESRNRMKLRNAPIEQKRDFCINTPMISPPAKDNAQNACCVPGPFCEK